MAVDHLIGALRKAGVEFHLWRGELRWSGPSRLPEKLEGAYEANKDAIRGLLMNAYRRVRFRDGPHEWILARDSQRREVSCGSPAWCQAMMKAVQLFADRRMIGRWVHLQPEHVELKRSPQGLWIARIVGWPDGYGPAPATKDALASVLSVCDDCLPQEKFKDGEADKPAEDGREEDLRGGRER